MKYDVHFYSGQNKGNALSTSLLSQFLSFIQRTFNIFQVYQYFTIYRWYFLFKFINFHEYLVQHSLKSGGTKNHFRQEKYLVVPLIERLHTHKLYILTCILPTLYISSLNFIFSWQVTISSQNELEEAFKVIFLYFMFWKVGDVFSIIPVQLYL